MKKLQFKQRAKVAAIASLAVAGVVSYGTTAYAAVANAGSVITNQATVNYEDSVGTPLFATSNDASVTVAQIYTSTLGSDNLSLTSSPSATVNFAHTITNNGNGTDTYYVSVAQRAGDSGDFDTIEIYQDGSANCTGANGVVDTGETLLSSIAGGDVASVSIDAGETACLVVAALVPAAAVDTNTFDLTVDVRADAGNGSDPGVGTGNVTDATDGSGGDDSAQGTNNNRVTVTADAVIVVTKTATPDHANRQIDYEITVRNNGAADANDVLIFDGFPAGTNLVAASVSASGISGTNDYVQTSAFAISETAIETELVTQVAGFTSGADVLVDMNGDGDELDTDESALGYDLNRDGDTSDSVNGIFAFDEVIPAGAQVSLSFTVQYDASLAANYVINNRAHVSTDNNDDGDTGDTGETPETTDIPVTVPQTYDLDLDEDSATDTDGDQTDGNDTQSLTEGAEGGVVIFRNVITNNGNGTDVIEIETVNDGGANFFTSGGADPAAPAQTGGTACTGAAPRLFPVGTTFSFFDYSASTTNPPALTNSNGTNGTDTGPLAAGASITIEVRAQLPSGTNGLGDYCASTRIFSAGNTSVEDFKLERLGEIIEPAVDVANDSDFTVDVPSAAHDAGGTNADVHNTGDIQSITTQNAAPGDTVTFDLYIQNEGAVAESFTLSSGSQYNNAITALVGSAFTVRFFDADGNNGGLGTEISSTGLVSAGGTTHIEAQVTISSDPTLTTSDFDSDSDGDTVLETIDGGLVGVAADGDGDYPFFFVITGNNSGATDVILNAIDVSEVESITVTPDNIGQVEQGGTVTYSHTVTNAGNTTETVQLTTSDTNVDFDPSTIRIDTDNDGTPDATLTPGISVLLDSGSVLVGGTVAAPTITLTPGDDVAISIRVLAQTDAGIGTTNTTTVTATFDVGVDDDTAVAIDTTTVVTVQIDPVKTAAQATNCTSLVPVEAFTTSGSTATAPGECIIWQVIIDNAGSRDAFNVQLVDNLSPFTTYSAGSLESCDRNVGTAATDLATACAAAGGTYCLHTDAVDDEAGCTTGHDADGAAAVVNFFVGDDDSTTAAVTEPAGDAVNNVGGVVQAGDDVTVRFRVRLDTN